MRPSGNGAMTFGASLPLCFCAAVLGAAALHAQQTPQATFKSSIELINIDVVVVDKDGNAVRGLAQKDFALTDRKKPQDIATFEEVSHERAATATPAAVLPPTVRLDVVSNTSSQADRLVMVVVDDLHIWKGRTDKAKALARDVITRLGAQASMALLFTSGEHSTQVTQDRSELLTAADTMQARQSVRRPHQAIDQQRAAGIDPEAPMEVAMASVAKAQSTSLQDFQDNMRMISTLQDAARMLGSEDNRRKAFVFITEGIDKSMNGLFDSTVTPTDGYHDVALQQMMEALRRSNVATYALDPRGKVKPEDMARELFPGPPGCAVCGTDSSAKDEDSTFRWDNPIRRAQDGLGTLAAASGGFAVTDTDDLTGGLQHIIEDLDHYYLLGFYPSDPNGDKYRPLVVTVAGHPEYTLRFRHGYTPGAPPAPPKNKDPLVALAAGVMPKSGLPLRITALPLVNQGGKGKTAHVAIALEITAPTGQMKDADSMLRDDVTYSVLVVDDKKAKVTSRTGRAAKLSLRARNDGADMPDSVTYQIPLTLDLDPGRYQLRASAMSKKLDRGGSVYLDVTVPDFSKTPLALSGIALGYADGSHVPVGRTVSDGGARGAGPVMGPSRLLGGGRGMGDVPIAAPTAPVASQAADSRLPFEPSLVREFASTDTLRAYFEVARKDSTTTVRMTMVIIDAGNHALMALDRAVLPGENGHMDLRIPLGPLGPGAYRMRITATDSHSVATTETGIIIK
jgi:VWFA-related protein